MRSDRKQYQMTNIYKNQECLFTESPAKIAFRSSLGRYHSTSVYASSGLTALNYVFLNDWVFNKFLIIWHTFVEDDDEVEEFSEGDIAVVVSVHQTEHALHKRRAGLESQRVGKFVLGELRVDYLANLGL